MKPEALGAIPAGLSWSFSAIEKRVTSVYTEVQYGTDEYLQTVALREEILRKPLCLAFSQGEEIYI